MGGGGRENKILGDFRKHKVDYFSGVHSGSNFMHLLGKVLMGFCSN